MDQPSSSRLFAVGDIHGRRDKLVALMSRLPFDRQRDTIVFLGDYINRGPDVRGVIEYLVQLRRSAADAVFLMGNHEHLLLEYAQTGELEQLRTLRYAGVQATLDSYGANVRSLGDLSFLPPEHLEFLEDLKMSHEAMGHRFVHADIHRGADDERSDEQRLCSRAMLRTDRPVDGAPVVFGHTPLETPLVTPDRIGIDTGAVYGNTLTALELPAMVFHHA